MSKPLKNLSALVTSGPTYEPIDPVRFIGNRSSGKQGHAIAESLRDAGAEVTLITGPVALPDPDNMHVIHVETAQEMYKAALNALPVDIAVCAAAVADWTPAFPEKHKIKKTADRRAPVLELRQTPDILYELSHHAQRPKLVVGFAAETDNLMKNALAKLNRKGCDFLIANLAGTGAQKTFGENENHVHFLSHTSREEWKKADKKVIAEHIAMRITGVFAGEQREDN